MEASSETSDERRGAPQREVIHSGGCYTRGHDDHIMPEPASNLGEPETASKGTKKERKKMTSEGVDHVFIAPSLWGHGHEAEPHVGIEEKSYMY